MVKARHMGSAQRLGKKPRLTGVGGGEPEVVFFFRGPKSLKEYCLAEAKAGDRKLGEFILKAVIFDRDLGGRLEPIEDWVAEFARDNALSLSDDLAEVIRRLVDIAREALEGRDPKKNNNKK